MKALFQYTTRRSMPGLRWWAVLFLLAGLTACKSTIALYDADTFTRTTALKEKTLKLFDHGVDAYAKYKAEAKAVLDEATALYERQQTRKNNALSIQQWKLLLDDNAVPNTSGILTGFFKEWENAKAPLTAFYVKEKKKKVSEAFDEILRLENAKTKK